MIRLYSADGEEFMHSYEADVLVELACSGDLEVDYPYYSADFMELVGADLVNSYQLLGDWDDMVADICNSDELDIFAKVSDEAKAELNAMVSGWIDKHANLTGAYRWIPKSGKEHAVTAEQIEEYLGDER